MLNLLKPNWSAPSSIHAYSTTRLGGVSTGVYQGLNLGMHVDDMPANVLENRQILNNVLKLSSPLYWLTQTHSTRLLKLEDNPQCNEADAVWTSLQRRACVVMTADCLPILVTDTKGCFVCAIHAGWRGLCDGIIEKSLHAICTDLAIPSSQLLVWLGPCISSQAFVVGSEVRSQFIAENRLAESAFTAHQDRYLADLHQLARLRLAPFNVAEITASEHCTFSEPERFYSYRRDAKTGRMASLIWID
ncbi:peptidoglycan editing factor PgeF [Psychromonas sp. MME2]|uniref:peptidoglycan editing factor PgeF n=1 Tax=unclassified Psychromonas TaxID=2614957 RepID=UPI00339CE782